MRGRIYSDEKCPECGGMFFRDADRRGLFCKKHPNQKTTGRFRVQFGRKTRRRFNNYWEAERFLDGLRWEVDQGTYDHRDYRITNPLGFETLALKWLEIKKKEVKQKSFNNLQNYISKAIKAWGQLNIKAIGYGEIEDFLHSQDISDKTKSNMKSGLHSFFRWVHKREKIPMPDFPEIGFELGFRKIIDKETQHSILDEIYRLTYHINPKIWLGIKWLSTYISIRPGELLNLKEEDIDIKLGYFIIPHPKEKRPKLVPIIDEDIEILKSMPRGLPKLYFFRHVNGVSGVSGGQQFGDKYFYKWWKKACENLGIEGVDLYGGTRHSSTTALREFYSPEQIRNSGTLHSTNKAFDRYLQIQTNDARDIYQTAANSNKNQTTIIKYE
ncbi:MAG: site-specific integrase [Pseudomonadota bacterium]